MFRDNQVRACDAVANTLSFNEPPKPDPPENPNKIILTGNCKEGENKQAGIIYIKTEYGTG